MHHRSKNRYISDEWFKLDKRLNIFSHFEIFSNVLRQFSWLQCLSKTIYIHRPIKDVQMQNNGHTYHIQTFPVLQIDWSLSKEHYNHLIIDFFLLLVKQEGLKINLKWFHANQLSFHLFYRPFRDELFSHQSTTSHLAQRSAFFCWQPINKEWKCQYRKLDLKYCLF